MPHLGRTMVAAPCSVAQLQAEKVAIDYIVLMSSPERDFNDVHGSYSVLEPGGS